MNNAINSLSQPTVMNHDFSRVPKVEIQRSSFDRSHGFKTTMDSGFLVPIFVDEVLPGDSFDLKTSGVGYLTTPITPFMDNLYMDTFYFFVPNRLIWDDFEKFNGEQTNPGDSTDFLVPQVAPAGTGFETASIYDYMGVPTNIVGTPNINNLHGRAYNLIYNEWFRDENLIDSVPVDTDAGPDAVADYPLRKRGKRHDYFTSCLPWPQKGDAVSLPLGGNATIATDALASVPVSVNTPTGFSALSTSAGTGNDAWTGISAALEANQLYADLTDVTAATINDLREAFQIQRILEKDARGGTRYTEIIRSHFGVTSPDSRLQRPEYLGGGSTPIYVNPVAQTSSTDATSPQGNLSAVGNVQFNEHGFSKSFTEHGVLIGICCVRADLTYQQGLNRMWSRRERYDFYWPSLAHIGEQAVLNKEIYLDGTADDDRVFGYQERFAEYRYKPSLITGKFRSSDPQSLDVWHLSQNFASRPSLNETFIEENPPVDRVIAVQDEPQFILDFYFNLNCARPMPTYSVPGLIDHF